MKENLFEAKLGETRPDSGKKNEIESDIVEQFFAKHREFFEWYAKDSSIKVKSAEGVMTPDGPLNTCAIDLKNGVMYLHQRFIAERYGGSDAKMFFGALHELEHFRELRDLLREKDGAEIWKNHNAKIESKRRYQILDNSFDDVKMNRFVVSRAPVLAETRKKLYTDDLFAERDLTSLPKHLQFAHILNCENQETGEEWIVASEVREAMQEVRGKRGKLSGIPLVEYATHPETPMSMRLKLQEAVIEPIYERLFQEDAEKKKAEKKGEQKKSGKDKESEIQKQKGEGIRKPQAEKDEPQNPEDYFSDIYDEILEKYKHATPKEEIEKEIKKEIERQEKERGAGAGQKAFEVYARSQGVTSEDLREYNRFRERAEEMKNPETNERIIDELREIFERIIVRRVKPVGIPKYPLSEGDLLLYPAEVVVRTRAGEEEPDVWEDVEIKEKPEKFVGDFDVIQVDDGSASMEGAKADAQRICSAFVNEALAEFSENLKEMRSRLKYDLHVRTENWIFGDGAECIKPLSEELSEKERVKIYKKLGKPNGGSTRDFLALEKILENLTDEEREKLASGKLKKIVIVMTDGESNGDERGNAVGRVQENLKKLREAGIVVIGIGILQEGKSALTTYAPEARLCERIEDLAKIITDLLKEHLRGL